MSRQKFNVGQEIISEDLNTLQSRIERELFDRTIYEILGRKSDAFFQDAFKIIYQSATAITIKAGLGFNTENTGTKDPVKKPLVLLADSTVNIDTPDSSNPRIDIIAIKSLRIDTESENRKYKDEFTDVITTQPFTVAQDWSADIQYVAGTPAGSPVAPATPLGYILVGSFLVSASTGIANQAAITELRSLLPIAMATTETGSSEYDAIVGLIGTDQGANYADLKSALDNAVDGWKILVLRDETINAIPVVLDNKIEIVFKRGVTFTKGSANRGLQINGNDCKIVNGRFSGFSTVGDAGVYVNTGALRSVLNAPRGLTCDSVVLDNGTQTYVDIAFTE